MSAPPIGTISSTPSASASSAISQKKTVSSVAKNRAINTTSATPRPRLIAWRCGSMIGLPDMRPSSFRKAMIEPVKVIAPIARPSDISMRLGG